MGDGDVSSWVEKITLPKSVVKVNEDENEFMEWHYSSGLTSLTLKGDKMSANTLSDFLFYFGELKASEIKVPKKAGKSENDMLIYKKNLIRYSGEATELVVPKGTVKISDYAFSYFHMSGDDDDDYGFSSFMHGNVYLEKITLPKSVNKIGAYAFYKCKYLKELKFSKKGKIKSVGKSAFGGTKRKLVIKAPKNNKNAYKKMFKNAGFIGKVK